MALTIRQRQGLRQAYGLAAATHPVAAAFGSFGIWILELFGISDFELRIWSS
jgi:hypothetical protein